MTHYSRAFLDSPRSNMPVFVYPQGNPALRGRELWPCMPVASRNSFLLKHVPLKECIRRLAKSSNRRHHTRYTGMDGVRMHYADLDDLIMEAAPHAYKDKVPPPEAPGSLFFEQRGKAIILGHWVPLHGRYTKDPDSNTWDHEDMDPGREDLVPKAFVIRHGCPLLGLGMGHYVLTLWICPTMTQVLRFSVSG